MAYTGRAYESVASHTQSRVGDLVDCISLGTQQFNTRTAGNQTGRANSANRYYTKLNSAISQRSEKTAVRYTCFWSFRKIAK